MLGDAAEEQPDVPITTDLDPPPEPPETVRFLAPPRTFIVNNKPCVLVTAVTSGGDSPEKLEEVVFEIVGGSEDAYYLQLAVPGRWSAVSTEEGLVAGKTFECYLTDPDTYALLSDEDPESLRMAVTLEARGTDPYTEEFPLDPEFVRGVVDIARSRQ